MKLQFFWDPCHTNADNVKDKEAKEKQLRDAYDVWIETWFVEPDAIVPMEVNPDDHCDPFSHRQTLTTRTV